MINLAVFLIALFIVLGFVGGTFGVIGAAFEAGPGFGIVAILGAIVFWIAVIAFVL